jgi:hypothetical protein
MKRAPDDATHYGVNAGRDEPRGAIATARFPKGGAPEGMPPQMVRWQ